MLTDWTQYSRFVSNQVRDKCRKGGSDPTSAAKMPDNLKPHGSMIFSNLPALKGSAGSLIKMENSAGHMASMESGMELLEGSDHKDVDISECQKGVVAILDMVGYTEFIQKLGDRKDVSSQIIARSIEVHFATIMDVLTEHGGDVIKIQNDSIVCAWRFKVNEKEDALTEDNNEIAQLVSLAVLSCIQCRDLLLQTQIWALEDIAEEFKGVKLNFLCGIGYGNILDIHVGAPYFRMSSLISGVAYDDALYAIQKAREASKINQVFVSGNLWDTCSEYLNQFEISTEQIDVLFNPPLEIITPNTIPSETITQLAESGLKNILHSSIEPDFSNGQIATFVNERVNKLVKMLKADRKQAVYYSGSWVNNTVATFIIKPEEISSSWGDIANEYQKYIELVLKAAKQYEMTLHKVYIDKDKNLVVNVTIIHGEASTKDPQLSAIKMGLSCSDFLLNIGTVRQVSLSICSGTGYEGILQGNLKSKYRLVSSCVYISEYTAYLLKNTGIIADLATREACKGTQIYGMFKSTEIDGMFQLNRLVDKIEFQTHRTHFEIPESFSSAMTAARAVSTEKEIRRSIVIEGLRGSGKTMALNIMEKHLQRMNFIAISAECRENQTFAHPLFPFQSILAQIIDNIDSITLTTKKTKQTVSRTQTQTQNQARAQAATGFNTTSDRANRLLERANTSKTVRRNSGKDNSLEQSKENSLKKISLKSKNHNSPDEIKAMASFSWKKLAITFNSKKAQVHPTLESKQDKIQDKGNDFGENIQKSVFETKGANLARLKSRLLRAGEDPKQVLPLLNPLIQPIIEETEDSAKICPDGRTLLLSGLLVRLLDKLSENHPIAILIDDVDAMDSASWTLALNIFRRCKRILMVFATHPCTCWRFPLLSQLKESPDAISIELHGSTTSELLAIIKKSFDFWAENIDKGLLDVIKHKTDGRYSYVFNLLSYLKDSDLIRVENNTLKAAHDNQSLEASIPSDFEELLLRNYDVIPSADFQKFMRCASVVGRHFSLEEVAVIMFDDPKSRLKNVPKLSSLVKIFDFFGLIQQRNLVYMPDQTHPYKNLYTFAYSELRDAIYKYRVSNSEAQAYHLKLLRFYEEEMNDDNEPTFLPLICYHGQFTGLAERDEIVQHIQYLAMYGNFLCIICESYKEVIELYTHMQKVIETHQLEEVLGPHLMSEIHIRVGHANSYGIPHEVNRIASLRHLMLATQLLEFTWPRAETEWVGLLSYEIAVWLANNVIKTFNSSSSNKGKRKWRKTLVGLFGIDDYSRDMKIDRLEHLEPILENMSKILYDTDAPMVEQLGCDILILNNAFRLGNYNSSSVRLLMSIAIKANFSGHKLLAISFADRCLGKELDAPSCASGAFFWAAIGKWEIAREWIEKGIILSKKSGDFNSWLLCTKGLSLLYLFEGNFPQLLATEEERKDECRKNGTASGVLAAETTILCIQVLRGDLEGAKLAKNHLKEKYREVSAPIRAQFQVLFAHLELANGNFMQAIDSIERFIELIPKIHYSNDSIFLAVLLSVLAIRSIHDKAKNFKPRERGMSKAVSGVGRNSSVHVTVSKGLNSRISSEPISESSSPGKEEDINTAQRKMSVKKPSASEYIVRSNRDKNGEISFQYKSTKAPFTPVSTGQKVVNETTTQIKKLLNGLLTSLTPFQNHIISEPFMILLKAMLKVYDPTLLKTKANDGPMALRLWVQTCVKRRIGEMKLLVALLAINCWKLSNESLEFTSDLNAGMSMLAEMGLDAELIF